MNKKTDLTGTSKGYKIFSVIILIAVVLFFLFPLYWIVPPVLDYYRFF